MLYTYLTGVGSSKMELQPIIFREVSPHGTTNSIYFQIIATKLPFLADIMQRAYQSCLLDVFIIFGNLIISTAKTKTRLYLESSLS